MSRSIIFKACSRINDSIKEGDIVTPQQIFSALNSFPISETKGDQLLQELIDSKIITPHIKSETKGAKTEPTSFLGILGLMNALAKASVNNRNSEPQEVDIKQSHRFKEGDTVYAVDTRSGEVSSLTLNLQDQAVRDFVFAETTKLFPTQQAAETFAAELTAPVSNGIHSSQPEIDWKEKYGKFFRNASEELPILSVGDVLEVFEEALQHFHTSNITDEDMKHVCGIFSQGLRNAAGSALISILDADSEELTEVANYKNNENGEE